MNFVCLLFLTIILSFSSARADDLTVGIDTSYCELALSGLNKIDSRLGEVFQFVEGLDPKLVSSERLPGWQDIEALKTATQKLKETKSDLQSKGELDQAIKSATEALAGYQNTTHSTELRAEVKNDHPSSAYKPTEYDLKRVYQDLIFTFNRQLPRDLRLPITRLPYDLRHEKLLTQARELVAAQEAKFDPFFSTCGFSDLNSLRIVIQGSSVASQKVLDLLENQYEFAMNRPENARWWVPKVGFQNTGSTGNKSADYLLYRNTKEAARTLQPLSSYELLDGELKPEYGYLRPKPSVEIVQSGSADSYGTDTYIFKNEKVQDRVTWTQGNSETPDGIDSENPVLTDWQDFFIPWKYRILGVPGMTQIMKRTKTAFEFSGVEVSLPEPSGGPMYPFPPPYPVPEPTPSQPAPTPPPMPSPQPTVPPMPSPQPTRPAGEPIFPVLTGNAAIDQAAQNVYLKDLQAFQAQPAYQAYEKEHLAFMDAWEKTPEYIAYLDAENAFYASYRASPVYIQYDKAVTQFYNDFYKTPAYLSYQKGNSAFMADWQKGPVYQKYLIDVAAYRKSAPYLQYLLDQKKQEEVAQRALFSGTPLSAFNLRRNFGYFELQYWGPVNLDDVEIFEFKNTPPSGEFLNELKKRNIKIRDGRVQPAVEWVEAN